MLLKTATLSATWRFFMLAENRKIGYITKHEASKTSSYTAFTPSA
nr:MAG TPA: hypothetical protein [Caudoviricetes sp.]